MYFLFLIILIILIILIYSSPMIEKHTKIKINPLHGCEVYPKLYIGNYMFASDKHILNKLGITHIINAAIEIPNYFEFDDSFNYLHLDMYDIPEQNVSQFFDISTNFIEDALKNGHSVLVHCRAGISRSSTIIIHYLMTKLNISYQQALNMIRKCRPQAQPNIGFMQQLNV